MDVHPPKNGINRYWSIPIWLTDPRYPSSLWESTWSMRNGWAPLAPSRDPQNVVVLNWFQHFFKRSPKKMEKDNPNISILAFLAFFGKFLADLLKFYLRIANQTRLVPGATTGATRPSRLPAVAPRDLVWKPQGFGLKGPRSRDRFLVVNRNWMMGKFTGKPYIWW